LTLAVACATAGYAATACEQITGDLDRVIAMELDVSTRMVEMGDTLRLTARAINASGEVVPEVTIIWAILDVDSGQVGFTLDSAGLVTGISPGMGRVQARIESLRSDPITIEVSAIPDSAEAAGATRLIVPEGTDQSEGLMVLVLESTTGQPLPIANKPVRFTLVDPQPGTAAAEGLFLLASDTVPGLDPQETLAVTGATGVATATLNRVATSTVPDSAAVEATALTAQGGVVAGSPIRFTVVFERIP
jgi:hypothetical protein